MLPHDAEFKSNFNKFLKHNLLQANPIHPVSASKSNILIPIKASR
jgi:hypothetical protein